MDATLPKSHLFSISSTLSEVLNQLDKKIVIGLIVFSSVIEIYEVEHVTFSSADVYRGDQVPSPNVCLWVMKLVIRTLHACWLMRQTRLQLIALIFHHCIWH